MTDELTEKEEARKYIAAIFFLIAALSFLIYTFANSPTAHFWKDNYTKNIEWCELKKPMNNLTQNKLSSFCFNEGWKDYCKVSYPEYCPDNNYSDYDRCKKSCLYSVGGCSVCEVLFK